MSINSNHHLNRNHKGYKRTVSALLAASLAFGGAGAVYADTAGSTSATAGVTSASVTGAFSDIATGFWAEKHIYKLAAQGIIIGNNGLFRPGDSVTQQEAVLMALRFMQLDGQISSTATALPSGIEVSNYYKPYVVLAFQNNLLDKVTESASDNSKTAWGSRKATREWVAELLVRALGKTSDAQAAASEPSGFADDSKISADKRGYINAAIDLGLTNGLSGNLFNPQGEVTRAQLATFLSRAETQSQAVYANTTSGIVTAIGSGSITLFGGVTNAVYSLGASTGVFTSTSETAIKATDIPLYSKVTLIGKNGTASYVELTDPKPQVENIQGTFARLSASGGKLWLKTADGYPEYAFDSQTAFTDKGGSTIDPATITEDSTVTIMRETYTSQRKILKVQVTSGVVNKTASGTLKSIDTSAKTVVFTGSTGSEESYSYDDQSQFWYQNTKLAVADLKSGSAVNYTIKNSVIQSIEVTGAVDRTVTGTLQEIGDSTIVYKTADGTRAVKLLADSPVIAIPGILAPTAEDLVADAVGGDKVELTLNSSDQVTKINVLNHQYDQYISSSVVSYDSNTGMLTLTDLSGGAHVVKLSKDTDVVSFDGSKPSLTVFGGQLLQGKKLNVIAIGDRALTVKIVSSYEGTIQDISPTGRYFTLKTSSGQSLKLYDPASVEVFGLNSPSLNNLAVGDSVTALLTNGQVDISVVKKIQKLQLQLTSVNAAAYKLGVKWGSYTDELNAAGISVTDENGASANLTALKAGDYINASFLGNKLLALQTVSQKMGQVTGIDAAAGTLTIKDFAGASQTFNVSGGVKIDRSGTVNTGLGSLSLSERVEIRKDADGTTIASVLPAQSKSFSSYDSVNNLASFKRSTVDEAYQFSLSPNVYIHQGDTTLSVQSLKENDKLTVYFKNNVIVEIVKQ